MISYSLDMMQKYDRMVLKISGEQLAGSKKHGIDPEFINWLAQEVKGVIANGTQLIIIAGAGNWIRGADFAGKGIERATADYMGMLSGVINGQAIMDIFQSQGIPTRVMSSIRLEQICEPYIRRKAIRHLEKGRVVIVSGGTGRPYVTHDTAGVFYALELDCQVMVKGSNVDGIYDKDPNKFDDAQKIPEMDFQQALTSQAIKVMDKAALGQAMENNMPIIVYNATKEGDLLKISLGEKIGTYVS